MRHMGSRCPFPPGSGFARAWNDKFEKALADAGLADDEVMSTAEVFSLAGLRYRKGQQGIALIAEHHPSPAPVPVFFAMRSAFYRRSEIEPWLSERAASRAATASQAADRAAARSDSRARGENRLSRPRSGNGYKCVKPNNGTFAATWSDHRGTIHVGNYPTAEMAALAVDKYRMLMGYPPCNFPDRVGEHDDVPILHRKRATDAGAWTLAQLARKPLTLDELWRLNASALPCERWKTKESLSAGLQIKRRKGQVALTTGKRWALAGG